MTAIGRRLVVAALALLIVALSVLLMSERLRYGRLNLDDFAYICESRTPDRLWANLWAPHNAHVVPLFRAWTYAVIAASGGPADWPSAFAMAAFVPLVLVMLAGGHLVARETGSAAIGLGAMAGLGVSTVMTLAATWFSASQALWSALAVLAMLDGLRGWRRGGGGWRLVLAASASLAAAALWSGGYAAGPVGLAYLWADGGRRARRAAWVPLAASLAYATLGLAATGGRVLAAANFHERPVARAVGPIRGAVHTAQAIPEVLVLGNLGLDAEVGPLQGCVLCLALAGLWAVATGWRRPRPLEVAGATLMISSLLLVYTFRGYLSWESVRALAWYHALPQVGAMLLVAGAWPHSGRGGMTGALVLALALFLVQWPRAGRQFDALSRPLAPGESARFPTPALRHARAVYFAAEDADRQRRFLARLAQVEATARRLGLGRVELRSALGRVVAPGWPDQIREHDALDLTALPERGRPGVTLTESDRLALAELLAPEPERAPPWER